METEKFENADTRYVSEKYVDTVIFVGERYPTLDIQVAFLATLMLEDRIPLADFLSLKFNDAQQQRIADAGMRAHVQARVPVYFKEHKEEEYEELYETEHEASAPELRRSSMLRLLHNEQIKRMENYIQDTLCLIGINPSEVDIYTEDIYEQLSAITTVIRAAIAKIDFRVVLEDLDMNLGIYSHRVRRQLIISHSCVKNSQEWLWQMYLRSMTYIRCFRR